MARTSDAAVRLILDDDSTISTAPFIEVANDLVTDVCSDSDYSATKLELIERWLSAHFYHIRDKAVASEKAGDVSQNFQYKLGLNLAVTMYGQQTMIIDTAGNLAALSKRAEAGKKAGVGVTWMGTGDSDGNDTTGD